MFPCCKQSTGTSSRTTPDQLQAQVRPKRPELFLAGFVVYELGYKTIELFILFSVHTVLEQVEGQEEVAEEEERDRTLAQDHLYVTQTMHCCTCPGGWISLI